MIYLDNNGTTIMPPEIIDVLVQWINKGNPSGSYRTARESKEKMDEFCKYIAHMCGFIPYFPDIYAASSSEDRKKTYQIIFNSGGSESNCMMITAIVNSYNYRKKGTPHIITSTIEHKSLHDFISQYIALNKITVSYIQPNEFGIIDPNDIERSIKSNTCFITIMHANNEIGSINDIRRIGEIAHKYEIPFYSDTVQTFGKFKINPLKQNLDAMCVSFHKCFGPKGVGALVIRRRLVNVWKLQPTICGSQNCEMRGGTENVGGIVSSYAALKMSWFERDLKNQRLFKLKKYFIDSLKSKVPSQTFKEYLATPKQDRISIVFFSLANHHFLPNTILLSIIRLDEPFCNVELKKYLEKNNIIVGIGSTCNTSSKKASHVIHAMTSDEHIKRGVIRISLADTNTKDHIDQLVIAIIRYLRNLTN